MCQKESSLYYPGFGDGGRGAMGYCGNLSQMYLCAEKDEAGGEGRASKYFECFCKKKRNGLSYFCSLES